jgi:argininosuccinate lyase
MSLWSGRFRTRLHRAALAFSSSLGIDKRLYREDIEGSLAHVRMLARQKIIPRNDATKIERVLHQIRRGLDSGRLTIPAYARGGGRFVAEDIHMFIESLLIKKLGEAGGKLHTGRSRNDQIAVDERLYLRSAITTILRDIRQLQSTFLGKAKRYQDVVMPGYTHLQRAQPILLAHHLLAYVSMLERDRERFEDCRKRVNRSPLGAGALAGTSLPIDRNRTAHELRFQGMVTNSIDAVSDRDVQVEFISCCAIAMMHLSRFAEELVLWSSQEWRFAEIGEQFTTGSSIMPQKKNPDMAELIRGKTGGVYGNLVALLTIMKGLPLAYNRDMQEDKTPLFHSCDTVSEALRMSSLMLASVRFDRHRFEKELDTDVLLATDVADYLVRKGMPFRRAHSVVGEIVQTCIARRISLSDLSLEDYRRQSSLFDKNVYSVLHARASVRNKVSHGSTSPGEVRKAITLWSRRLK